MSMNLFDNLGLQDVACVDDPFGRPVLWYIRHVDHPAYQQHIKDAGEASLIVKLRAAAQKAMTIAGAQARGDEERAQRKYEVLVAEYIGEIPEDEWVFSDTDIAGIALLIDRWEGDGYEFSYEAAVAGLSRTEPIAQQISVGDEFTMEIGSPLGHSLAMWVVHLARKHEMFRADVVEAVEKN